MPAVMSVVRDLILQADDDLRYPSSGELRSMVEYLSQGAMRLSVVKILTDNIDGESWMRRFMHRCHCNGVTPLSSYP